MNFLWCGETYVGNSLFTFTKVLGPIFIFIFIFSLYNKISSNFNIENKILKVFFVLFLSFSLGFSAVIVANIFKIFIPSNEIDDGCICGCTYGSYAENRIVHAYDYFVMCLAIYLNLARLYWCIFKNKIKSKKYRKKKNIVILFIIISVVFIGVSCGIYGILDHYAPGFEIYESLC